MNIPLKGKSEEAVMELLGSMKGSDSSWEDGRMFGHAFFAGETARRLVERAYTLYLWENALDPTLFQSLLRLENEVVDMARTHLGGDWQAVGSFTSGGTESIMLAVKAARDMAREKRPKVSAPEMVVPLTAHAAFHKAAHYLGLKVKTADVDPDTYKTRPDAIREAITENTVLLVASAPSYAHGVVDPVPEIGAIAQDQGIPLHVDACMGGFLLPFWRRLGARVTEFDFSVPGVTSISMDFHKYAFAAKGASVVLYRNKNLRRHQIFACSGWTGYTVINPTIQSSRSGGPLAATWAMLNFLGEEGYLRLSGELMQATAKVVKGVNEIAGLKVLGEPEFCILGVAAEGADVFEVVDEMKSRGWHVQAQFGRGHCPANFHLTILPPNLGVIDEMLSDLAHSVEAAREKEPDQAMEKLLAALSSNDIDLASIDMDELIKAAGIEGDELPERMAGINRIMNSLPPEMADALFTLFFNEVNRAREV